MKAIHFMRIAFAVFVIIPALLVAASCDSEGKHEKDEQRKREEIESKVQADLASKYGASVDWHKKLDERKILDTPYSIDMEEALILLNNKPIVFDAFVEDVTKSDNKYFVRLDYSGSPQIYF